MMRYALISDIHSNFVALKVVLESIEAEGVDRVLCAGDAVGYNAQPNQVVNELRNRGIACIRGNHDDALLLPNLESMMNSLAVAAIRWTRDHLTEENTRFIAGLKPELMTEDVAVFHGSPFDPYEYIYEHMVDERLALFSGKGVTVLGHTHVPYIRAAGGRRVINPGSVGQPRDGDARASFALLNGDSAEIRRVAYDIESTVDANVAAGIPSPLSERLRWGV